MQAEFTIIKGTMKTKGRTQSEFQNVTKVQWINQKFWLPVIGVLLSSPLKSMADYWKMCLLQSKRCVCSIVDYFGLKQEWSMFLHFTETFLWRRLCQDKSWVRDESSLVWWLWFRPLMTVRTERMRLRICALTPGSSPNPPTPCSTPQPTGGESRQLLEENRASGFLHTSSKIASQT